MSKLNLNLLPSQAKFQAAKIKLKAKVRLIMVAILSFWVAVVGLVLGLELMTKTRAKTAQAQYDSAKSNYLAMSDSIVTSQKLKFLAKSVGAVLKQRFEYGEAFKAVEELFPEGIVLTKFDLKTRGSFALEGLTSGKDNMDNLEEIVANINSDNNEKFKSAKITSLNLKGGLWTFKMEVIMK